MRRLYTLFFFLTLFAGIANAQLSSSPWSKESSAQTLGSKPVPAPASPSTQNAPIDGGLSLLLAAGALYGGRTYRNHKKRTTAAS